MKKCISSISAILLVLVLGCPAIAGNIVIKGSTTVEPIAQRIAESFMMEYPDISIELEGGGSGNGIKAIIDGSTDIGNCSRYIKKKESNYAAARGTYPVPFRIAYDCIVPVVHPSNPAADLSLEDLKGIYTGAISNWNQIGGPDRMIRVISRDTSSGTYEVWESKVLAKEPVAPGAVLESSNGDVVRQVAAHPSAIGYIGIGYLENRVKPLSVNRIKGTEKTTLDGSYPISRPLFMFTRDWPTGDTLKFINYVLEPGAGQVHVKREGFVSVYQTGGQAVVVSGKKGVAALSPDPDANYSLVAESLSNVKMVQQLLKSLGHDVGPIDGIKGQRTISGIIAFQKEKGMPVDWRLSSELMDALSRQYMESIKTN